MDRRGDSGMSARGVDERLPLASLAARRAVIQRVVDGRDLPRFSRLCDCADGIRVRLAFCPHESGCVCIAGVLNATVSLECHRCLEAVTVALSTDFTVLAVMNEVDAARLGAQMDVLEVATDEPPLVELIEDELMLALPQRPCAEEHCDKAPPIAYPPGAAAAGNPFRSLAALKES